MSDEVPAARLLVDLRVTQVYRERGIPRYIQSLLLTLARRHPDIELHFLIEEGESPLLHDALREAGSFCRQRDIVELAPVSHYLQACLFDRGRDARALFPPELACHRPSLGAILYDLIPWLFPGEYLNDPEVARGYQRGLDALCHLDRLFAISDCSRVDAIAYGCTPERVVTVYGGWDEGRFAGPAVPPPPLPERYWLYVGGDDPRKNLKQLFAAFTRVRRELAAPPALVVVCSLGPARKGELRQEARRAGLDDDGLMLTGFLPDGALPAVFRGAVATIFPSRYEGLGLPILESYAHGRAALASNNSSLIELTPEICRFDADDAESIAGAVLRFHADPALERASLAHAAQALALCRWDAAADRLALWLRGGEAESPSPGAPIDVVTTLPPDDSGVALYTLEMLAGLARPLRLHLPWGGARLEQARRRLQLARWRERAEGPPPVAGDVADYQPGEHATVWVLGNSEHHLATLAALFAQGRAGDWLYLHEARLEGLLRLWFRDEQRFKKTFGRCHHLRWLLDRCRVRNILANSEFCAGLVRQALGELEVRIETLFLPVLGPGTAQVSPPADAALTVMHLGILGTSKQPELLVAACERLAAQRPVRLVFAGYLVRDYLEHHGLMRPWIEVLEAPDDAQLERAMQSAQVAVQLRWPQHGESSGAVCHWLALKKPVVTTRGGSFAEFDGAAWLVPPEATPDQVAAAIARAAELGAPSGLDAYLQSHSIAAWRKAFLDIVGS